MKNFRSFKLLISLCFFILPASCTEKVREEKIPVTTTSERASELYTEALNASLNFNFDKADELYAMAVKEDPDFFLPYYQMAIFDLYFGDMENYSKNAVKAVAIDINLSPGEELLRESLGKWLENPEADLTETGNNLVEMYPRDEQAYNFLAFCQYIAGNNAGQAETYRKALEIAEHKEAFYNALGYSYMNLKNFEEAEKVFDMYIELDPNHPNPWDSKGDYYMAVGDYENAAGCYMKAYQIDTTWKVSYHKALEAKAMLDPVKNE